MDGSVRLGNPPIEISLRRSARARRLSLRVSRLDGRVTLTLPRSVSRREALGFVRERETWLRGHLSDIGTAEVPRIGGSLPFEGRAVALRTGAVRAPRLAGDTLVVPSGADRLGPRLAAFLRLAARDRLTAATDRHARALGLSWGRLTLRDTRSRWGSCTSEGNLMYSWRLVMAPPEILDYVAAHEVCHLQEMNHGPAFWRLVETRCAEWRARRDWLRENGAELHRLRFGA